MVLTYTEVSIQVLENIHQMPKKSIKSTGIKLLNKKRCIFTVLLVVISLFLSSCGFNVNPADIVIEYQVPFAQSGHRWNKVEFIEKDEYGRELYRYKSGKAYTNVFRDYMGADYTNAPVLVYIIIQKIDKDFVYCYDDFCYTYIKSFEEDNSTIIDYLKEINDWGKSIDYMKFNALSIDSFDEVDGYKVTLIAEKAVDTLGKMLQKNINDYYLDDVFLDDTTPIFVLREVINREKHEFGKSYVFNMEDERLEASYFELSEDINKWNEEIHNFKMTLLAE